MENGNKASDKEKRIKKQAENSACFFVLNKNLFA